jgi:hypothetical protein
VTSSINPLTEEFRWLERLLTSGWLQEATLAERRTVALKVLRVHGIGALVRRSAGATENGRALWDDTERRYWAELSGRLFAFAGGSLPALSRRDAELTRAAATAKDVPALRAAVERHIASGRFGDLVTVNPLAVLSRDSVLRHYVAERLRAKAGVFTVS